MANGSIGIGKSIGIVTILHPDEGSMGKYSPEYQLSSRVAMSQLKEPRVMKVDMRSEY